MDLSDRQSSSDRAGLGSGEDLYIGKEELIDWAMVFHVCPHFLDMGERIFGILLACDGHCEVGLRTLWEFISGDRGVIVFPVPAEPFRLVNIGLLHTRRGSQGYIMKAIVRQLERQRARTLRKWYVNQ